MLQTSAIHLLDGGMDVFTMFCVVSLSGTVWCPSPGPSIFWTGRYPSPGLVGDSGGSHRHELDVLRLHALLLDEAPEAV